MKTISVQGKHGAFFTPTVVLDSETGACEISGQSYLENTTSFYQEMIDWMKEYTANKEGAVKLKIFLTYFNTSSSKCLAEILWTLKDYKDAGGEVEVAWHYEDWDEDMRKEGEDFVDETGLEMEFIEEETDDDDEEDFF
ncbi:MAG: hypothetical protein ACI85I_000918 [Arenicella sp.]|jgi:hypothetical protein